MVSKPDADCGRELQIDIGPCRAPEQQALDILHHPVRPYQRGEGICRQQSNPARQEPLAHHCHQYRKDQPDQALDSERLPISDSPPLEECGMCSSPTGIRIKSKQVLQSTAASHWTTGQAGVSGRDGAVRPCPNEAGYSLVVDDLALHKQA